MPRTAADKSPERSATPTPSIATSTTPNGAKLVKFVTRLVKIMRIPSAFNKLTARIMPSSATPRVPAGLGSSTASPIQPKTPERRTMPTARTANKVTGCGRKLPNHSTVSRKRVKALRRLRGSGVGAFVIAWVFVLKYQALVPLDVSILLLQIPLAVGIHRTWVGLRNFLLRIGRFLSIRGDFP